MQQPPSSGSPTFEVSQRPEPSPLKDLPSEEPSLLEAFPLAIVEDIQLRGFPFLHLPYPWEVHSHGSDRQDAQHRQEGRSYQMPGISQGGGTGEKTEKENS